MTSPKPRRGGGSDQTPAPADTDQKPAGDPQPEQDTTPEQAAPAADAAAQGTPEPAQVDPGLVRPETGISPEPVEGPDNTRTAASDVDRDRNGAPADIGSDTSGKLRKRKTTATAAHGRDARNGVVTGMDAEDQLDRGFGSNGDAEARLAADGVRAETGAGTLNPDLPDDERATYPSTTVTRSSSDAAPIEPEDVKRVTEPKLGVPHQSTDPIAAASAIQSHTGDETVRLLDRDGNEVKPSQFFTVPDGPAAKSLRIVDRRVSREYTVRKLQSPSRNLLFIEGQEVPVEIAEQLIALHG